MCKKKNVNYIFSSIAIDFVVNAPAGVIDFTLDIDLFPSENNKKNKKVKNSQLNPIKKLIKQNEKTIRAIDLITSIN